MKRVKKQVVYVRFWDHAYGPHPDRAPLPTEAVGFLTEEDDLALYVSPWIVNDEADNSNNETFTIIKSCILQRKLIKTF